MTTTWYGDEPPPEPLRIGLGGGLRILLKGGLLAIVVFGGLGLLLIVRILERPVCGLRRPVTPHITVAVCRLALLIIGLKLHQHGNVARDASAIVANHASWLDIFVLNARKRIYFVSKSDVAHWPGIGWLARATGTLFIERKRARAVDQAHLFKGRLRAGHRLLFFPEGTSSDGQRVLPFKSSLFAAFFTDELRDQMQIQPVTLCYCAPKDVDPRFYCWWGDMDFGPHFLTILAAPRQGYVALTYHTPLRVVEFSDRKSLATAAEHAVRRSQPNLDVRTDALS
ncbi:MAG: lysophospholipid acyltransferase family protein [Roseobacter sp.]